MATFECTYHLVVNAERTENLKETVSSEMKVRDFVLFALEKHGLDTDLVSTSCVYSFSGDEFPYESEEFENGLLFDHHGKGVTGGHIVLEVQYHVENESEESEEEDAGSDPEVADEEQPSASTAGYPVTTTAVPKTVMKKVSIEVPDVVQNMDTVGADQTFVADLKNKSMDSLKNLQRGCVEDVYKAINTYKAVRDQMKVLVKEQNAEQNRLSQAKAKAQAKDMKVITVNVSTVGKTTRFSQTYEGINTTISTVRDDCCRFFNFTKKSWKSYSVYYQETNLSENGRATLKGETLSKKGIDLQDGVVLQLRGAGLQGGGFMKVQKSISKPDSLKALKMKAFSYATEDDESYVLSEFPLEFQNYVKGQSEKIDAVKLMVSQGTDVVQVSLMNATEEALKEIQNIMGKKFTGKKDTSEARLATVIDLLLPTLSSVRKASLALSSLHGKMLGFVMEVYIGKYHYFYNTEARYDHQKFLRDVDAEMSRRNIPQGITESQTQNCVIC